MYILNNNNNNNRVIKKQVRQLSNNPLKNGHLTQVDPKPYTKCSPQESEVKLPRGKLGAIENRIILSF